MRLHPLDNGCEKGALFTPQMYEVPERAELAKEIEASAGRLFVFIDIGANVGLFSLFVASKAGPGAKIVAVEPDKANLRRLRFNIAANPGVPIRVLPIALGEAPGMVAVEPNHRDRGGTQARPCEIGTVECLTLLEVLQRDHVLSIDALKIDVEGDEDRILVPFFREADECLWPRLILIEDNRDCWRADLFEMLAHRRYVVAVRTKQNVVLHRKGA